MSETEDPKEAALDPADYEVPSEFSLLERAGNAEITTYHEIDAILAVCNLKLAEILGDDVAAKEFIKELEKKVTDEVLVLQDPAAIEKMLETELAQTDLLHIPEHYLPIFVKVLAEELDKDAYANGGDLIIRLFSEYLDRRYEKDEYGNSVTILPTNSEGLSLFFRELARLDDISFNRKMMAPMYEGAVLIPTGITAAYLFLELFPSLADSTPEIYLCTLLAAMIGGGISAGLGGVKGGIARRISSKIKAALNEKDHNSPIIRDYLLALGKINKFVGSARAKAGNHTRVSKMVTDDSERANGLKGYLVPLVIANGVMSRVQRALDEGENHTILNMPVDQEMLNRERDFRLKIAQRDQKINYDRAARDAAVLEEANANIASILSEIDGQ